MILARFVFVRLKNMKHKKITYKEEDMRLSLQRSMLQKDGNSSYGGFKYYVSNPGKVARLFFL